MFKKVNITLCIIFLSRSLYAHEHAQDMADSSPLFSIKELKKQYRYIITTASYYKRCVITGPCTQKERAKLRKTVRKGGRVLGKITAFFVLYFFGKSWLKNKLIQEARDIGKEVAKAALEEIKETVPELLQAGLLDITINTTKTTGVGIPCDATIKITIKEKSDKN